MAELIVLIMNPLHGGIYILIIGWKVVSIHWHGTDEQNGIDTGFNYTWRAHAIHWGEPVFNSGWKVSGYHYLLEYHRDVPFDTTYAETCNIIDGW